MGSIRLSPKHGVNPAVPKCFYCQEDKNQVILAGRIGREDLEAPRNAVWDFEPCDKCQELMEQGIILISVDEEKTGDDLQNPFRTGGWVVVKEETFRQLPINPAELVEDICKKRMAFIPDDVWKLMKLPLSDYQKEQEKKDEQDSTVDGGTAS